MNEEKLKQLLYRYYDGNTSEEEETVLREFFSGNDIIPGYDEEKEIFFHYSHAEIVPNPSDDLEIRILRSIDNLETTQKSRYARRRFMAYSGIAATFLLLIGSYFLFFQKTEPRDTFSDPQIAYAETMKILNDISVKLNKGTKALQPLTRINNATRTSLKTIDKSASVISTNLKQIAVFNKLSGTDIQTINTNNNK
jgi:hypothetical protein